MNLHEYQAKDVLKKFDLPILKGQSYENSIQSLEKDLLELQGPPWVIKSQIHAGGRGAGYFKNSFNKHIKYLYNNLENQEVYNSKFSEILKNMEIFDSEDDDKKEKKQELKKKKLQLKDKIIKLS